MAQSTGATQIGSVLNTPILTGPPLADPILVFLDAKPEQFRFIIQNYDTANTYTFTSSTAGLTVTRNETGANINRVTVTGLTAAKPDSTITVTATRTNRTPGAGTIYGVRVTYQNIPTVYTLPELNSRASSLMPRDAAGNIELISGSSNNTVLIIDTYQQYIAKKNINNYLNTRFNYFKFPAQTSVTLQDFTVDTAGLAASVFDEFIFAKYGVDTLTYVSNAGPLVGINIGGGSNGRQGVTPGVAEMPGGDIASINTNYSGWDTNLNSLKVNRDKQYSQRLKNDLQSSWTYGGVSSAGSANSKIKPLLDFNSLLSGVAQSNLGAYTITEAIKQSGVNLRFRIQIKHTYTGNAGNSPDSRWYIHTALKNYFAKSSIRFSIIKSGDTGTNLIFKGPYEQTISTGETKTQTIDVTIPNADFKIGDKFSIGVIAKHGINNPDFGGGNGNYDYYFSDESNANDYFKITAKHEIIKDGTYWSVTNAALNVDVDNQPL